MTSNTDTQDASAPHDQPAEPGRSREPTSDREPGPLSSVPYAEFDVGPDDVVAAECPYCDRPFSTEAARDLHVGEDHDGECTDEERAAYEAASDVEHDDLFYFHLRIVAALGVLYGVVVLVYMLALGSGII